MTTKHTIYAVMLMLYLLTFTACEKGNGVIVTQTFELENFDQLNIIRHADVYITQGTPQSITIEGEENLMELIKTEVMNGEWTFDFKKAVTEYQRMTIHITMPTIHSIMGTNGSGANIYTETRIVTDTLTVAMEGDGAINADINVADVLTVNSVGSGSVTLSGTADRYVASSSGGGIINSINLVSDHGSIDNNSLEDAQVHFTGNWNANITNSGNIRYKGIAPVLANITGTGEVVRVP